MKRFNPSPASCGGGALLLGMLLGMALRPSAPPGRAPLLAPIPAVPKSLPAPPAAVAADVPQPPENPLRGFSGLDELQAAFQRLRKLGVPPRLERKILLQSMIQCMESGDYTPSAFERAWAKSGTDGRNLLASVRLEALAVCRPGEFFTTATAGGPMALSSDVSTALGGMAESAPGKAMELWRKLDKEGRKVSSAPLFTAWGRGNPQEALAACGSMAKESEKNAALTATYSGWMLEDLKSALVDWKTRGAAESGLQFGDNQEEWASELFWGALKKPSGGSDSEKLISAVGERDKAVLVKAGLTAMAASNSNDAVTAWKRISAGGWGSDMGSPGSAAIAGLLEGMAWDSPRVAMDFLADGKNRTYLREQSGGGAFPFVYAKMADQMVGGDPMNAARFVNELQRRGNHQRPETNISIALAERGAKSGDIGPAAFLAEVENEWVRTQAASAILDERGGALTDPEGLLSLIARPEDRNAAAARYVDGLLTSDFTSAATWAVSNDEKYPGSVKALVDGWARWDVEGATGMLAGLAPEERQDLIPDLAVGLTGSRPATAMAWALSMDEGAERTATLAAVAARAAVTRVPLEALLNNKSLTSGDRLTITDSWNGAGALK